MSTYNVFVRNWWRRERGVLVPNSGGRKKFIRRDLTHAEARQMCQEYNRTHKPGVLSRKAEFEGSGS